MVIQIGQKKDDDRANQSADWEPEVEPPTLVYYIATFTFYFIIIIIYLQEQCPRGCMDCVVEVALEILQQCCCRRRVRGGSSTLNLFEPPQTPRYGGSRLGHSLFSIVGSLCCSFFRDRT